MSRSTIRKAAYLSGPMTGHEDYNYPRFHEVAGKMRARGYAVINPAESYDGDQSLPFSTYMRWDILQLVHGSDAVVLLEGWEQAPGAVFEVAIAAALGYSIFEYRDEVGGFSLKSALPLFDTDRERLAYVLAEAFTYPDSMLEPDDEVAELLALEPAPTGPEPLTTWAEADSKLLLEADRIVNSDRQRTYGHPITHHTATAAMWSAYLTRVNDEHDVIVRPQDVSILMVLDKASRIGGGDKVDNALDIAGYAQVHAKVRARQTADNGGVFE